VPDSGLNDIGQGPVVPGGYQAEGFLQMGDSLPDLSAPSQRVSEVAVGQSKKELGLSVMRCYTRCLLQIYCRQLETATFEEPAARREKIGPPLAVVLGK
jgi:hypothetical protein